MHSGGVLGDQAETWRKQAKASKGKQMQAKANKCKGKQKQANASKCNQMQAKANKCRRKQAKASKWSAGFKRVNWCWRVLAGCGWLAGSLACWLAGLRAWLAGLLACWAGLLVCWLASLLVLLCEIASWLTCCPEKKQRSNITDRAGIEEVFHQN